MAIDGTCATSRSNDWIQLFTNVSHHGDHQLPGETRGQSKHHSRQWTDRGCRFDLCWRCSKYSRLLFALQANWEQSWQQ
jgi:hypothetical protein